MQFEENQLYHIYNQGNNRRKIFIEKRNYYFFLKKIETYITPYADILAWCLMPNHFHIMVKINHIEISLSSLGVTRSHSETAKKRSLNDSIAIMLRSYTRAINKQEGWSGALFRECTKAACLNSQSEYRKPFYNDNGITKINITHSEFQYPQNCFNYIHRNPIETRLARKASDYEFSSAKDYSGLRNNPLVNKKIAAVFVDTEIRF